MARKLVVEIVGDASSLDRAFKKSSKSANQFGQSIDKAGAKTRTMFLGGTAKLLGAGALFLTLKSAVSAASDLEQQIGKTNVVFGKSGREVIAWSETLAQSFGLSQREALTLASTFGALLAPIGIVGEEAANQSRKLVELGADLASFYNTDVQSALDAIRSGIVGEAEPLRKYGVLLSESRVQQEALVQTGKKHAANLTAQEKVLARISLLYKDTSLAQGDFARTSDDAAQQSKILSAELENLKTNLGRDVLPAFGAAVSAVNDFFEAMKGPEVEGAIRGETVETVLVPLLAKRIAALRKAGKSNTEILALLRQQVGDGGKASDLIAEAFRLTAGDAKLAERLRKQAKERREAGKDAAGAGPPPDPAAATRLRRAREALRLETQARAAFAVERAAATATLTDDLQALNRYNALLARRIRGGHATLELEREQFQVQQEIADVLKRQAEARAEQREARQFRALGLGPGGADLVPSAEVLRKQLGSAEKALQGTFLDTKKTRSLVARIRKVLSGAMGAISEDVRSTIQRLIDDLRQMQKTASVDVTRFQKTARGQFGLAGAAGGGRGIVITGGVHVHGVQNVQQLENALAKRHRQRARQRRSRR